MLLAERSGRWHSGYANVPTGGTLELVLTDFIRDFGNLRTTTALISSDETPSLNPMQSRAVEYLCRRLEFHGDIKLRLEGPLALDNGDENLVLTSPLPFPLNLIRPTLEVHVVAGELSDLRAPCIEVGVIDEPTLPREQAKEIKLLLDGLPSGVAKSLDDYIRELPTQ